MLHHPDYCTQVVNGGGRDDSEKQGARVAHLITAVSSGLQATPNRG